MQKSKKLLAGLMAASVLMLVACSDSSSKEASKKQKVANEETVKTFLLYKETATSETVGSTGDLFIKTFTSESEKIASDVLNGQYEYNPSSDTVLFLNNEHDLYKAKNGSDKEKIASDVTYFSGAASSDYIFYHNDEHDLYIVDEANESEKIASSVDQMDLIDTQLYYLNEDGNFNVYDVESRKESNISADTFKFEVLNEDGDLIYLNDDFMLFYKENGEDAVRISSKKVLPSFIQQLNNSFVYIASEDDEQVLYQTKLDGSETNKIATDVSMYEINDQHIVYLTFDQNLFMKKPKDDAAFKLASDVSNFDISANEVIYMDKDAKVYTVTFDGEKSEKAQAVISMDIAKGNQIVYENKEDELFIDTKKIATDVDGYALFNNHIAYATNNDQLYFVENLGEPIVIEEDLSKYSSVTYQNELVFSNYLTFEDIRGNWEITSEGQSGLVTIDQNGKMSNALYGTTIEMELVSAGHHELRVMAKGEALTVSLDGDLLVVEGDSTYLTLKRTTKTAVNQAQKEKAEEKKEERAENDEQSEQQASADAGQLADATLDTVPFPGALNTVDSMRSQLKNVVEGYLYTYAGLNMSELSYYVDRNASFYDQQLNYMINLYDKGISMSLTDVQFIDLQLVLPTKFTVTTAEEFVIYGEETKTARQKVLYTLELIEGDLFITEFKLL